MKNPPAFQFYPKDFLSDFNVMMMTMEEVGMYITLLSFCWMEGELPNDISALAKLCRCQDSAMANAWQKHIAKCFELSEDGSTYVHRRLQAEREKQKKNSAARSEAGKKGAFVKHSQAIATNLPEPCQDFAEANSSLPNSPLHIPDSVKEEEGDPQADAPPVVPPKPKRAKRVIEMPEMPDALKAISGLPEAWEKWRKCRAEARKPITPTTAEYQFNELLKSPDPLAMIANSISKGYAGLYDPKPMNGQAVPRQSLSDFIPR